VVAADGLPLQQHKQQPQHCVILLLLLLLRAIPAFAVDVQLLLHRLLSIFACL
jgi:hypothetical protein